MAVDYEAWRPRLAQGIDDRFFSIEYLDWLLANKQAFFFANENAAIVAELKQYPSGALVVHGLCAAGDIKEIEQIIPEAEAFGKSQGCAFAMISSGPGWGKVMKKHGYDMFQASIVKEL